MCPLRTNGLTRIGSWTRCQGQRSAVLVVDDVVVVSTSSDYQIPPLPFPPRATQRADANDPYFYSPLSSRLARRSPHSLCAATFGRPKGICYLRNKRPPTFCLAAAGNRFVLCTAGAGGFHFGPPPRARATHVFGFIITLSPL